MSEMQQTRKMEQPKVEPQQSERGGTAKAGDAGDHNKGRNIDLNTAGRFDSAAGRQAVAEHLRQPEGKKAEAQPPKHGGEGDLSGGGKPGDAGDHKKGSNTDLNTSGHFDNAAGRQAVAEHLRQQEGKKAEAQPPKQGGEGAVLQQREMSRSDAANVARVSASDHNNRPRESLKPEAKPTEEPKMPTVKGA